MQSIQAVHAEDFKLYDTEKIRERFLIEGLIQADQIVTRYTHYDRMIVGGAMPVSKTLTLETAPILRADYFLERRELGIICIGGKATIKAGNESFELGKLDCLYVGKGVESVSFSSSDPSTPAMLYFLSAPAHANYPTTLLKKEDAESNSLGSNETSNQRTIYRYIHKNGIKSCQLVMGLTLLEKGSVWNTMPAHAHDRRMEAYFYFDIAEGQAVFHFMGEPQQTRHILIKNYDAVVSPPWSIHSGCGTSNYGFIWGMAGENLEYTDMDSIQINELR